MVATIEQVRALGSPLKSYQFRVLIEPRGNVGYSAERFSFLCISMDMPQRQVEPVELNLGPFRVYYAGRALVPTGGWRCTFVDLVTSEVTRRLSSWHELIFNTMTGVQSVPEEYKADAFVYLLNDARLPVRKIKVRGIWPSEYSTRFEYRVSDAVNIDVTFMVDYWIDVD